MLDDDDTDDLAEEEVDKILNEVLKGTLKDLPSVASDSDGANKKKISTAAAAAISDDEEDADDITKRFEALRS